MDPLSLAAVLLPVSKSICTIVRDLEDIRQRIQNAPSLLMDLISECHVTETVTHKLGVLLHSPSAKAAPLPDDELRQCFHRCQTVISPLLDELQSETDRFRASKSSRLAKSSGLGFWDTAKIVWREDFLKESLASIRAWRSQIEFIIHGVGLETNLNLQAGIELLLQRTEHLTHSRASTSEKSPRYFISAELQGALSSANTREVERLLLAGADPNVLLDIDETPLLYAIKKRVDCNILKILIDFRARLDSRSPYGETALHVAVRRRNMPAVRILIDSGANAEDKNQYGQTPLHQAADECYLDAVRYLLIKNADPCAPDDNGCTPLHATIGPLHGNQDQTSQDRLSIIGKLLAAGADPLSSCDGGWTPIHKAAARGYNRELDLMVKRAGHGNVDPEADVPWDFGGKGKH